MMNAFNQPAGIPCSVLATDLDGTLIPLPAYPENKTALQAIRAAREKHTFTLIFATGRHFSSVEEAMVQEDLPLPDWIVCDVGTSIYHRDAHGFRPFVPYAEHLKKMTGQTSRDTIESLLTNIEGLALQKPEHQQTFKISFECATEQTELLCQTVAERLRASDIPYHVMGSRDPFLDCGLIDVLPAGVTKAYALIWLSTHADFNPETVMYAGDSGNDLAALVCGFHAVVVANATDRIVNEVKKQLNQAGMPDRFFAATKPATSGVLEGCRHYRLF